MSVYARFLYIPVFLTMAAACTQRTSHVVANRLAHDGYNQPRSDAYDIDAWAKQMAARDHQLATDIEAIKADLQAKAHFDFFPPEDKLIRDVFHPRSWRALDREMIRQHLRDVLVRNEKRRRFEDTPELQREAAQAQRILTTFINWDTRRSL